MAVGDRMVLIVVIALAAPSISYAGSNMTFLQRAIGPRPCWQFIHSTGGRILSQSARGRYENKLDCKVTIVAPPGNRILLNIDEFDVADSMNCYQDEVIFYDGRRNSSPQLSGSLYGLCGNTVPEEYRRMVSTGNEVTIRFITDGVSTDNTGFSVSYTAYIPTTKKKEGDKCFQCDEDPMCIDPQLKCDGLNNCIDGSDEKDELCFVGFNSIAETNTETSYGWLTWPGTVIAFVCVSCYIIGVVINCYFNCCLRPQYAERPTGTLPPAKPEDASLRQAMLPTVEGVVALRVESDCQIDQQSTCHTNTASSKSTKTFPAPASPRGRADGSLGQPITNEFLLPHGYGRPTLPSAPQSIIQEINPQALAGYLNSQHYNSQWSSGNPSCPPAATVAPSQKSVD